MGEPPSEGGGSNLNVTPIHWKGRVLEMPNIHLFSRNIPMFCQVVDGCIPIFVGDMAAKRRQKVKPRAVFTFKANPIASNLPSKREKFNVTKTRISYPKKNLVRWPSKSSNRHFPNPIKHLLKIPVHVFTTMFFTRKKKKLPSKNPIDPSKSGKSYEKNPMEISQAPNGNGSKGGRHEARLQRRRRRLRGQEGEDAGLGAFAHGAHAAHLGKKKICWGCIDVYGDIIYVIYVIYIYVYIYTCMCIYAFVICILLHYLICFVEGDV